MSYETIIYGKNNRVAKITLNRPEALNSQTRQMVSEIGDALDDAERDENIRAIIITGRGRAFCTGMDLKWAKEEQNFFRFANETV